MSVESKRGSLMSSPTNHSIIPITTAAAIGLSSPIYRGTLNHGSTAELQEGFRVLTSGQKMSIATTKELMNVIQSNGLHVSEEELTELLRVVHQDERTSGVEFSEFMLLMTKDIDVKMVEDMRSAFEVFDKEKTGFVSRKEFTELFITMGERSSSEELEELMLLADPTGEGDKIDYNKFVAELALTLNKM